MNFERARSRMVEEQLVSRGISDSRVLASMERVERHRFVGEALRVRAYDDKPLPIGERQTISQPFMVGLMTQALELKGGERVLEIGTGCGYQTAVLAELAANVFSIERLSALAATARAAARRPRVLQRRHCGSATGPSAGPRRRRSTPSS